MKLINSLENIKNSLENKPGNEEIIIEIDEGTNDNLNPKFLNTTYINESNYNNNDFLQEIEMNKINGIISNENIEIITEEIEESSENQDVNITTQIDLMGNDVEKKFSLDEENLENIIIETTENELNDQNLNTEKLTNKIIIINDENIKLEKKNKQSLSHKLVMSNCRECGESFNLNKNIEEHFKLYHPTLKPFECDICYNRFTKLQAYNRHCKIHKDGEKNKLCTYCEKAFTRADDLKRHIRIHTNERPYQCTICFKSYKQTSELKEHLLTHTKDRKFNCEICGKILQTRNGLYVHLKVHQGIKNHKCELCGNCYVTSGELQSHIKHIHNKDKPYLCTYDVNCKRSFSSKTSLDIHLRSHSGERPFKCTTCDKHLASLASLNKHKKIHTKEIFVL